MEAQGVMQQKTSIEQWKETQRKEPQRKEQFRLRTGDTNGAKMVEICV